MKFMICGHARHGKDTVADILKATFGLKHDSSSHIAMNTFLRDQLAEYHGLIYDSAELCYADRVNHRAKWFDLISEYNRNDPARLARLIFSHGDIYVGIRSIRELRAAREEGLFDLSVWVDASRRHLSEHSSSNTITPEDCDFILSNNGTIEELQARVKRTFYYLLKTEIYAGKAGKPSRKPRTDLIY